MGERRLSERELAAIRAWVQRNGDGLGIANIQGLLDHIEAIEAELAEARRERDAFTWNEFATLACRAIDKLDGENSTIAACINAIGMLQPPAPAEPTPPEPPREPRCGWPLGSYWCERPVGHAGPCSITAESREPALCKHDWTVSRQRCSKCGAQAICGRIDSRLGRGGTDCKLPMGHKGGCRGIPPIEPTPPEPRSPR